MGTEETHFQDLQVRILAPGPEEVTAVFALRSRTFFLLVLGLKGVAKKKKELRETRTTAPFRPSYTRGSVLRSPLRSEVNIELNFPPKL